MSAELLIRLPDYFPSLIDAMQDGFVLRGTDGTIAEVNRALCEMLGYDRSEMVGTRPPHIWWDDGDRERYDDAVERFIGGEVAEERLHFRRRTGERFPALVSSSPLRDIEGQIIGFIGTIKDMSEWTRTEERLQFQAQLIDQVAAAIVVTSPDGTILLWNRGAEQLFGWSSAEAIGRTGFDLFARQVPRTLSDDVLASLRAGNIWDGEITACRRDGSRFPAYMTDAPILDRDGSLVGIVSVSVDITERKRVEDRLALQYAVTRTLADAQTVEDGIHQILRTIGEQLDWQAGGFWSYEPAGNELRCADFWNAAGIDTTALQQANANRTFHLGEGLPGVVWAESAPRWIRDVRVDPAFTRATLVGSAGLRSAVAFPVETPRQFYGVVECFTMELRDPDEPLLAMTATVGNLIGQFIERRRAEEAVRESEGRFRMMANSAPVLLWMSDATAMTTWFNTGWLTFTGRTMDQELGHGWAEGVHPDDFARCLTSYLNAFEAREQFEIEYRLRRADGQYRWVLDTGVPRFESDGTFAGMIGSCLDIHDRRQAAEDDHFLSEATRVLASSLDYRTTLASVARLAVPRIADWCVVHILDETGFPQQEALAHIDPVKVSWALDLQTMYPIDMSSPSGMPNVIRTGTSELYPHVTDDQLVAAARDPEHLDILRMVGFTSAMIVPVIARDRVLGAISFISAELGRRYGEREISLAESLADRAGVAIDHAQLYQEAQDASRARDQFLAVAAHELRSPLTSMKGFAQLLLRRAARTDGGEQWLTPLQTIDAQVNRVTGLVNRLLDVSRIEEKRLQLEVEPVDLASVTSEAVREVRHATEDHQIILTPSDHPIIVELDRARIEQVLFNLLDNAMKYSPAGTQVVVSTTVKDGSAVVRVRDQGPGIPPEFRTRLFERYVRGAAAGRSSSEGLGLGLYVAHGIVEAHGGRMWIEDAQGRGSVFAFALPLTQPPEASA